MMSVENPAKYAIADSAKQRLREGSKLQISVSDYLGERAFCGFFLFGSRAYFGFFKCLFMCSPRFREVSVISGVRFISFPENSSSDEMRETPNSYLLLLLFRQIVALSFLLRIAAWPSEFWRVGRCVLPPRNRTCVSRCLGLEGARLQGVGSMLAWPPCQAVGARSDCFSEIWASLFGVKAHG